jgi:hypothetical protein
VKLSDVQKAALKPFDQLEYRDQPSWPGSDQPRPKCRISVTLTVWCGGLPDCDEWLHLEAAQKRHGAREAKRAGWKLTRERGWLCPRCAGEA